VQRRWDTDERGHGLADARRLSAGAQELLDAMLEEQWVAEEPELHLLSHLRAACERDGAPLALDAAEVEADGTLALTVSWHGDAGSPYAAAFALLGEVAEPASYVRFRKEEGALVFDVVTGLLATDTPFATHGHTLRLTVVGIPS
jgi:hypothetical protein